MEMAGYTRTAGPAEVGAEVGALGLVGLLDRPHAGNGSFPDVARLVRREILELGDVAGRHHHQVAARVGVGVEQSHGMPRGVAPDHVGLLVRHPARQDPAEHARTLFVLALAGLSSAGDELGTPARPDDVEVAHGCSQPACSSTATSAATSAFNRSTNSLTATPRSGRSVPRALTPTVPPATSSSPTTRT